MIASGTVQAIGLLVVIVAAALSPSGEADEDPEEDPEAVRARIVPIDLPGGAGLGLGGVF